MRSRNRSFPLLFALGFSLACAAAPKLLAGDWHVSGDGDDAHDGTTSATAFRSLKKAASVVQPGDTVSIGAGVYSEKETGNDSAVLFVSTSGRPDAWITWRAVPGTHPELHPVGWNGIMVTGSYHVFDGLTVMGNNDAITLSDAYADGILKEKNGKKYSGNPYLNTNGISLDGRKNPGDRHPHHLVIRNCTVAKCAGGGISMLEVDYVTIEDCLVYDNCWFMRYAGSGITSLENWAFDDNPGYHFIYQRNQVWNNKTLVPWMTTGKLSDGNGILCDVTDKARTGATNPNADAATNPNADAVVAASPKPDSVPATSPAPDATTPKPPKPVRPDWHGRTLIANNVSAFNGGSGIHAFRTAHVDIVNNTTYWNGSIVGYQEVFPNRCDDIVILNNVIVPRPAGKVTSNYNSTNVRWDFNLYPTEQNVFKGEHDVVADPGFVKVARDLREADFRLTPNSPGLDSGTDDLAQPKDVLGQPRPAGKGRDRGAFEQ